MGPLIATAMMLLECCSVQGIIKGEFYENAGRKDFTVLERVAILEEIENRQIGHKSAKGYNL